MTGGQIDQLEDDLGAAGLFRLKSVASILLGSLILLVFVSACGPAADEQSDPGARASGVLGVIDKERARLREIPGRQGILAEERRYSLFDEELIIRDFFQDRRGGFFLDVGCAWPIESNNTYYLEKHLDWKGIGIDALDEFEPAWMAMRPQSKFFSYLVTDLSGAARTFFRSSNPGLSSMDRKNATGAYLGEDLEVEAMQVESITLNKLLDREGVTKLDLLAMDIEGHEPKALAGFDIDRFRPELAVIEGGLVPEGEEADPVYRYFDEHGYVLIEKYRRFDSLNRYFKPK